MCDTRRELTERRHLLCTYQLCLSTLQVLVAFLQGGGTLFHFVFQQGVLLAHQTVVLLERGQCLSLRPFLFAPQDVDAIGQTEGEEHAFDSGAEGHGVQGE